MGSGSPFGEPVISNQVVHIVIPLASLLINLLVIARGSSKGRSFNPLPNGEPLVTRLRSREGRSAPNAQVSIPSLTGSLW